MLIIFGDFHIGYATVVGFTAVNSNYITTIHDDQVLVFNSVVTNVGNDYDPQTGIFLCSVGGLYVFYVDIRTQPGDHICWFDLVKNGSRISIVYLYVKGDTGSDSTMSVVHLEPGDKVWIRKKHYYTGNCQLDSLNTFTGYMMHK